MPKILIVEDDPDIASLEKDYLELAGFSTFHLESGDKVLGLLKSASYDLMILDVMLPGKSGYEILKELRAFSNLPVILVTAKDESADIIRGLGLGSDDYVTKPFDPAVLVARVKANLKKVARKNSENAEIALGSLRILPKNYQVFKNDEEIKLPNKEFELLLFLAEHPNIVYSKEDLFESVWGLDSLADDSTITVHINRLREKLEQNPEKPALIQTVWGVGYKLVA